MRIRKRKRAGVRILALLLSSCLLAGFVPEAKASSNSTDESGIILDKRVEKTADGFKLVLESYATGSDTVVTQNPQPLDIVLVLDESGSMALSLTGCDDQIDVKVKLNEHLLNTENYEGEPSELDKVLFTGHRVFANSLDPNKTYRIVNPAAQNMDDATREVSYCAECKAWRSSHISHNLHNDQNAIWMPFSETDNTPYVKKRNEYHVQFYEVCDGQSGQKLLQAAVSNFLRELCKQANADNVNHRVAIVGFGLGASYIHPNGKRDEVYGDRNSGFYQSEESAALAYHAWHKIDELTDGNIATWVNSILANGTTCTHVGIQAAELAFNNAPETPDDEKREKVMILFTDSVPGADSITFGPDRTDGQPDWITPGIESAQRMKADGTTIYSVGLFPYANGYDANKITYNPNADGDLKDASNTNNKGFYQNGNCYLHVVSSNYPNATSVYESERGNLSDDYIEQKNSYYLGTENANDLSDIFNQVLEDVTEGTTTVTLDAESVLRDVIAENFQIVDGLSSVTAWTESYKGVDSDGTTHWEKDKDSVSTVDDADTEGKLHISVNGQSVSVTNFDFAENFIQMEGDEATGKKLVVEILIKPTDDTPGGTKLPTNKSGAGVYENENSTTPVAEFPLPHVDLPTTVAIQKVVKGSESTESFSFDATYVKTGDYEDIDSGVENGSNYLHFTTGTSNTAEFALGNGRTQTLENVEVGSFLTISEETLEGWATPIVTTSTGTQALTPDDDGKYTVTVTPGMVITFTNTKELDGPDPDVPEQPEKTEPPKDDVPQTGVAANLALWISLLTVSVIGFTTTLVLGKKKR